MEKQEKTEICTIDLSNGILDNDYTFYEDGTILRFYDRSSYPGNYNLQEWLKPSDIDSTLKNILIKKCEPEHLERIKNILEI